MLTALVYIDPNQKRMLLTTVYICRRYSRTKPTRASRARTSQNETSLSTSAHQLSALRTTPAQTSQTPPVPGPGGTPRTPWR
ncbi:hypothetical protein GCM10010353_67550 [Streptomyces chryseus]|nr:hypothetical protein GCM10010353_67550 [Streptomyces chryseus]